MKVFKIFQYTTVVILSYLQLKHGMQFINKTNENFQQTLSDIFATKNINRIKNVKIEIYLMAENVSYKDEIIECITKKDDEHIPVHAILFHQTYFYEIFGQNDAQANFNNEVQLKLKDTLQLTKFYQKNILNVLDFFKVNDFYCIIQERNANVRSLTDMIMKDTFTNWIVQKIILHKIYAFMYLSFSDILKRHDALLYERIDEKYNFKNGAFFSFIVENTFDCSDKVEYILVQNEIIHIRCCPNCRNFKNLNKSKIYLLNCHYGNLLKFCKKMSEYIRNHTNLELKKEFIEFIEFMEDFSFENTNNINNCINHPFFSDNIISISDFKKFKFKKLRISSGKVRINHNKIIFKMFENKHIVEITINETANKILLFSERIHYHSLDIQINKTPIDPDQEDEEGFKKLKSKIEGLFFEIELYTKDKILLELTNDYLSILKYKTLDSYAFILKKHYIKDTGTIFAEFNDDGVLINNLSGTITNLMSDEYGKELMIFLKEIITVEHEILGLIDRKFTMKKLFFSFLKLSLNSPHVELPYVYVPGVGIKKLDQKSTENECVVTYIIDGYEIVSISEGQYSIKNLLDNDEQKIVDISMMGYYMPKMQVLLEASYFKIIK